MVKTILSSISTLFIVIAILFVMAVAVQVFVDDVVHPRTLFVYLLLSATVSGLATSAISEKANIRLFGKAGDVALSADN